MYFNLYTKLELSLFLPFFFCFFFFVVDVLEQIVKEKQPVSVQYTNAKHLRVIMMPSNVADLQSSSLCCKIQLCPVLNL